MCVQREAEDAENHEFNIAAKRTIGRNSILQRTSSARLLIKRCQFYDYSTLARKSFQQTKKKINKRNFDTSIPQKFKFLVQFCTENSKLLFLPAEVL